MPLNQSLPSVMSHNFSRVNAPKVERSTFDRSHGHKTTFDAGKLIPFFVDEILPGDTLKLRAQIFARLSTLVFPIMDNVFLDTFFFFVPTRLVWNNWEKFNGAQEDPGDSIDFSIPILSNIGDPEQFGSGSIADYFGLPTLVNFVDTEMPNALPFRAYNLIWNEWFRDQNMQLSLTVQKDDGPDDYTVLYDIRNRGKRHDYFTSCLPWPQKGTEITLPLGTQAPVIGNDTAIGFVDSSNPTVGTNTFGLYHSAADETVRMSTAEYGQGVGTGPSTGLPGGAAVLGLAFDATKSGMIADLSAATAATINQLREAFAFQAVLETDARGGTRYTELLKAHFGVAPQDYRLQRPEYLGGSTQRIDVRGVAQTSETAAGTPQGNLSAYAAVGSQSGFMKSFPEHGYVIGLVNVRADLTYQQGLHRMWTRQTRYDFYLPQLAHLGEQAVLNKEIYFQGTTADEDVFGYQERWAEYRYKPSIVTGAFRSNHATSLDSWHLAINFGSLPSLNATFIEDSPDIDRIVAVPAEPHVLMDSYFSMKHTRPMPVYSTPGQIGRF